jgi:acetate kinase
MGLDILCINAGSSSLKFAVFSMDGVLEQKLLSGEVEDIGEPGGRFRLRGADARSIIDRQGEFSGHEQAVQAMFAGLHEQGRHSFAGAGHRIVHGGPEFYDPQRIDGGVLQRLGDLVSFAPLHLPSQIGTIRRVAEHWPGLLQVACFDTAFHRGMPEVARRFPLSRACWDQGIFRYGFHGLSYEFVVGTLGASLGRRAIIAHLGNGASMVALKDGASIDTSMGLTPAGGFMMGTRSGDLDPGILLYLMREGWTLEQLSGLIEHQSGLAGVSGGIGDMKILLSKRESDPRCAQAVDMFCYQIRKFIGAYAAALGGIDTLVFTGGIGERAATVRAGICRGLEFLGIELDEGSNGGNAEIISAAGSACIVRVVRTDEDVMIARHTRGILIAAKSPERISN